MNLSQLELLVAVVETGNFSDAADKIGLTQSAVSHGLAKLETELGVTLIERGRRGVSLTGAGQEVLVHTREALVSLEAIRQAAAASRGVSAGRMRLGAAYPLSARLLVGILGEFQRQYPDVDLVYFEGTAREVEEWVAGSVVDVGIVLHPTPNAESRLLVEDEICVVFPADHRFRRLEMVSAEELVREPLIIPKSGFKLVTETLRKLGEGDARLRFQYTVSDPRTIFLMAREGLGVAFMPRTTLPDDLDGLMCLPMDPPFHFRVGLGVRSWETATPVAKLFTQTAEAWAASHGFLPHGRPK
ncbi:putative HTH-type transcriptional regulator YvbU [Capsulimonas corticalis]|uniref:HTH-type transcriptional regulator YvbU n=1 Tax=Capsulimonas corticalis TaxID=2219043 RepID=A0A402D1P2_9BACT|nr:LysR family transcriptional regulator [Capsulimonas corticalis]BDI28691.1 putative HTH-type transcriptional regulator YvbU [Capsulimonas corticalis]